MRLTCTYPVAAILRGQPSFHRIVITTLGVYLAQPNCCMHADSLDKVQHLPCSQQPPSHDPTEWKCQQPKAHRLAPPAAHTATSQVPHGHCCNLLACEVMRQLCPTGHELNKAAPMPRSRCFDEPVVQLHAKSSSVTRPGYNPNPSPRIRLNRDPYPSSGIWPRTLPYNIYICM